MRRRLSLAGRLFAAQALVVSAGAVTLALVATFVGPSIFHRHLLEAAGYVDPVTNHHVEEAYASANALSFAVALAAGLAAALAASAFLARRVARPVGQLADAVAQVADGDYTVRLGEPGLGPEFDTLAAAFTAMAARLESVEGTRRRMLGDLGHEMRTPLATIEAYLDAAEDGVGVDDEDTLTVLRTQTARLRRLAEDIASVSRAEEHQLDLYLEPVPPGELVHAAVTAAQPGFAAKGVDLREDLRPGVACRVRADRDRMGQVLGNLIDNALRHTPAGGAVTVGVRQRPAVVEITVADTGEGIDAEHLPHVFERFYRADTARDRGHGGSGIGLAIVRAVVTEHGGTVTAHSLGRGTGTTVTVSLPAA